MELCRHCLQLIGRGELGKRCTACCNAFDNVEKFAREIAKKMDEYEYRTFQVGSRVYGSIAAFKELMERRGMEYDIKRSFTQMLSRAIAEITGKIVSSNPDITVIFDLETFGFELQVRPVYIYGRYIKRVRNISQTRWLCRFCNGKGCEICNYTGKRYVASVEELVATPVVELFEARDAKLHGAGREDVDARMLGRGRPFVLEVIEPRKRFLDIGDVERVINEGSGAVKVRDLEYTNAEKVREVKMERHRKKYRAKVVFEREVDRAKLIAALEKLRGEIEQRTPRRVAHRRADRVRVRKVFDAKLLHHTGRVAVIEIEAEAGLYIKELVSGDEGRTKPSLSELLGVESKVEKLDVLDVFD